MNFKEIVAKKAVGFYLALASAAIALVGLIIFFAYSAQLGFTNGWVVTLLIVGILLELSLFYPNEKITLYVAILPSILFSIALGLMLNDGVGNIVDALQGIIMFGNKALAGLNYTMAAIFLIAAIVSTVSVFFKTDKVAK